MVRWFWQDEEGWTTMGPATQDHTVRIGFDGPVSVSGTPAVFGTDSREEG